MWPQSEYGLKTHYVLSLSLQEQYETVFDAVLVFLDSFDTYSNFGQ